MHTRPARSTVHCSPAYPHRVLVCAVRAVPSRPLTGQPDTCDAQGHHACWHQGGEEFSLLTHPPPLRLTHGIEPLGKEGCEQKTPAHSDCSARLQELQRGLILKPTEGSKAVITENFQGGS